jgi:hypothetical protein
LSLKTSYDLMACNFIWEHTRKSEKRIDKVKKKISNLWSWTHHHLSMEE